ncbi:hypothetical protein SRB5_32700 [Streptomyces sp. RB5]|uniref:Secreted protein n=1 Tax=Streptomyces smaragdinus TaxID=2585196 RepID=A0A7K0CI18_9ACTN|nr:hypothetical protein [Streptomyces smaragdinus]MQY13129.1 hypothetical protein [Streptomyces smaragdinus]
MTDVLAPEPAPRRRRPRFVAPVLVTLAVLGATGGGIAYAADWVRNADTTADTTYWQKGVGTPKSATRSAAGHQGLGKQLLPIDDTDWHPGPDMEEFGNDAELTGKQALALLKQSAGGLPPKLRRAFRKEIEKRHIEGQAMRSYASLDGDTVVEIQLTRMSAKAAKETTDFQKDLSHVLDDLRAGPAIKGYKSAVCYYAPKDTWRKQDVLYCTAAKGDVLLNAVAYGPRKLDGTSVVTLLRAQLDRISAGESA